jgi:tRNA pseudouridine(55) synthase
MIKLYKRLGETPLECILRFRAERQEYAETKMTYLGRLDPMAEGLLLVLACPAETGRSGGGSMKDKGQYLGLDKTYEFEVLWGFESDTYDILGLIKGDGKMPQRLEKKMEGLLQKISMKKSQEYPAYSSRTVSSKSLFMWAREGRIEEVDIPTRNIKIFSMEHIHTRGITGREILKEVLEKISRVTGDFRQEKVLSVWRNALIARPNETFLISKFAADVSSGTYIRGLAHEMGKILDTGALAYSIKRTRVGEYKI